MNNQVIEILVPTLNESITIARFIEWCHEGSRDTGYSVKITIIDSSTDSTPQIARIHGAHVIRVPKRGLGRAYIDSIPYVQGKYVILGDADCTYDFRNIEPFIRELDAGNDFVMGSRFRGTIEAGAMPLLHQYFGTPVTTMIFNLVYGTRLTDIHCGMRALTTEALHRLDLQSQSWEYASEMLLKAVRLNMKIAEVPISFLRAPDGRLTHHQRSGWLSPWLAGWENLRAMFTYAADYFLLKPGVVVALLGITLLLLALPGTVVLIGITLALNAALIGLTLSVLGMQMVLTGIIASCVYDLSGATASRWHTRFAYSRTVGLGIALAVVGSLPCARFLIAFAEQGFVFTDALALLNREAVGGVLLIVYAFLLCIHALVMGVVTPLVLRVHRLRHETAQPDPTIEVLEPLGRMGPTSETGVTV